jgi:hypothetical protein
VDVAVQNRCVPEYTVDYIVPSLAAALDTVISESLIEISITEEILVTCIS